MQADLSRESVSGGVAAADNSQRRPKEDVAVGKQDSNIHKDKSSPIKPNVDSKENTTEADLVLNEDLNSTNDI